MAILKLYNGCNIESLSAASWMLLLEGIMETGFVMKSEILFLSQILTDLPCSLIVHQIHVFYF